MRYLILLSALVLLSCSAQKKGKHPLTATMVSDCPKDGTCSIEIYEQQKIVVKNDEFGRPYYTLEASDEKKVIRFTYNKKVKENLQDASYKEEVLFEINNQIQNATLKDQDLANVQLLFGRFCYCKGQTGYYKINTGTLNANAQSKIITLDFKTTEVPQVIQHLAFSLK